MIDKKENPITERKERHILEITQDEINVYLDEVKEAIRKNRYRIERNQNRGDNNSLFLDYVINETMARDILMGLTATDFSERVQNEHIGFEHEFLYIFGEDVELLERMGDAVRTVSLYIKFNKLDNCYVIVVSMHEQRYPIRYYFR